MAQIDGEEDFSRHNVAAVGTVLDETDARHAWQVVQAGLVNGFNHAGGAEKGIAAQKHGGRAGVGLLPLHRYFIPAHSLDAGDHADHAALGFENGPLLDMQLEHCLKLAAADPRGTAIVDALAL